MSGLLPNVFVMTLAFTGLAFGVTLFHLGPGLILYLAALGPAAAWFFPMHLAVALPPGLFGGALLAASGPRTAGDRPGLQQVAAATLTVVLVGVYLVGWVLPEGYRSTSASMDRFQNAQVERRVEPPASFDLPRLLADDSAEAKADLRRRIDMVAPSLVFGLIAALLVWSPLSWSYLPALGLAAVAFIWQMRHFSSMLDK